jgi:hypothetical protein
MHTQLVVAENNHVQDVFSVQFNQQFKTLNQKGDIILTPSTNRVNDWKSIGSTAGQKFEAHITHEIQLNLSNAITKAQHVHTQN